MFSELIQAEVFPEKAFVDEHDLVLRSIVVGPESFLCGKMVRHCRLREDHDCMLIGFENDDGQIGLPEADRVIEEGDTLWIVGEKVAIRPLISNNVLHIT